MNAKKKVSTFLIAFPGYDGRNVSDLRVLRIIEDARKKNFVADGRLLT